MEMTRISKGRSLGDEFDRGEVKSAEQARWREGNRPKRRGAGQWRQQRWFGEAVPAAVELAGKESRGGELRRGVERGGGSSEKVGGARRSQGGRLALQTAAQAAGGQGKPPAAVLPELR